MYPMKIRIPNREMIDTMMDGDVPKKPSGKNKNVNINQRNRTHVITKRPTPIQRKSLFVNKVYITRMNVVDSVIIAASSIVGASK